jgi:hypothetical protein
MIVLLPRAAPSIGAAYAPRGSAHPPPSRHINDRSASSAAELGDSRWKALLDAHHRVVRRELETTPAATRRMLMELLRPLPARRRAHA